jgi:hypothetical protein
MLPIIVVSFNNGRYVRHMVDQLCRINPDFASSISILDNASTDPETLAYLDSAPVAVIRNPTNEGPWISPFKNRALYDSLPDLFVLTDPDLELNPNLPSTFLDTMVELAGKYGTSKIGFALDISHPEEFLVGPYVDTLTIAEHEAQFWVHRIPDSALELYRAPIDTTFCLVNKRVYDHGSCHIRIAGDFTAKHLPWYKANSVYSPREIAEHTSVTAISTTGKLIRRNYEQGLLS